MSDRRPIEEFVNALENARVERESQGTWVHRGLYSGDAIYDKGNVVQCGTNAYLSLEFRPGPCPGPDWQLLVEGTKGDQGERGYQGAQGKMGQIGPPGVMGAPGRSIRWRGKYAPFTLYNIDDVVHYDNALWIALQPTEAGPKADQINWDLVIRFFVPNLDEALKTIQGMDAEIEALKQWDIDHLAAADPHTQYLLPSELPQTAVAYLSATASPDFPADYSLITALPTNPESAITGSVNGSDVLLATFARDPALSQDVLYKELETRVVLEMQGDKDVTYIYARVVLRHLDTSPEEELGVSTPLVLAESRAQYVFPIQILGPVQAMAGDWTVIEVYGGENDGKDHDVAVFVDGTGISRSLTYLPIPAYPAEHAPSHDKPGGSDIIPTMMYMVAPYVANMAVKQGAVAKDGNWLMHANKDTDERAAPQPSGEPTYQYDGVDPTTQDTVKQIVSGQRYTTLRAGFVAGYRTHATAGQSYTVYSIRDPLGTRVIETVAAFTAASTGWVVSGVTGAVLVPGEVFDLVQIAREADPTPSTWSGNWDYNTPKNDEAPDPGEVVQSDNDGGLFRIHKTDDDGGDRSTELEALTIGDQIHSPSISWAIQTVTDDGAYMTFGVSPGVQSEEGVQNFDFDTLTATPITYLEDADYWPAPAVDAFTIKGLLAVDGGLVDVVEDDNAYGTDIQFQDATASDDWDVMSYSG